MKAAHEHLSEAVSGRLKGMAFLSLALVIEMRSWTADRGGLAITLVNTLAQRGEGFAAAP